MFALLIFGFFFILCVGMASDIVEDILDVWFRLKRKYDKDEL